MRPETESQFASFLRTVARASQAALLLDYDGTLAPFRVQRDKAYPYPGVESLLQEIVDEGRTKMAVISGRNVEDVLPLLDIRPSLEVWGAHGMQRLREDGTLEVQSVDDPTRDALTDAGLWLGSQRLREYAEFKTGSIAVHWRGLSEHSVEDIRFRVTLGWGPIAEHSGLNLLSFDGGVEIRARQANKANAVRAFLAEIRTGVPAAYLGDDSTDESAFQAMRGRGITVLVRPTLRPTAAEFWLKPPDELVAFLELWLKACVGHNELASGASAAVTG